jgi:putative FmdB family regulatory protein
MPTYDYSCSNGHRFEVFQRMSDDPVSECPECSASAERHISGGAGFLFKGDGFYITDSRSDEYKKKASADSASGSSGDSSSSSGNESSSGSGSGSGSSSGGGAAKGSGAAKTDSGTSTPSKD